MAEKETSYITYRPAGPVVEAFHKSKARFRGLMGPLQSGKSVACCIEVYEKAKEQVECSDGVRRSKWMFVRNTLGELMDSTVDTWIKWFPPEKLGAKYIKGQKPGYTLFLHDKESGRKIEIEILFRSLDQETSLRKLFSVDLTGVWLNEAQFMSPKVMEYAMGRVTRYPPKIMMPSKFKTLKEWGRWGGVIADTNPPSEDSWWWKLHNEPQRGPPGIFEIFQQPSGLSPEAENLENVDEDYYEIQEAVLPKEVAVALVHGQYSTIKHGKPVYGDSYNDSTHVVDKIVVSEADTIYCGVDFGLTPAAVFGKKSSTGQWQIFHEMCTLPGETISLPAFADVMNKYIGGNLRGRQIFFYGDPSGIARGHDGVTAIDIFRKVGIYITPAPTNKLAPRRDAVLSVLERLVKGEPGFVLDKSCSILRKGFNGGYKFRKIQISGEERYSEEPNKNEYSHVHDALQYLLCGGGEFKEMSRKTSGVLKPFALNLNWKVFK